MVAGSTWHCCASSFWTMPSRSKRQDNTLGWPSDRSSFWNSARLLFRCEADALASATCNGVLIGHLLYTKGFWRRINPLPGTINLSYTIFYSVYAGRPPLSSPAGIESRTNACPALRPLRHPCRHPGPAASGRGVTEAAGPGRRLSWKRKNQPFILGREKRRMFQESGANPAFTMPSAMTVSVFVSGSTASGCSQVLTASGSGEYI